MSPERRNLFEVALNYRVDFRHAKEKLIDCLQALDKAAQILNLNLEENLERVQEQDWFRTPKIVAIMVLEEIGLRVHEGLSLRASKLHDLRTLLGRLSADHPDVFMSLSRTCSPDKYGVDLAGVIREFAADAR